MIKLELTQEQLKIVDAALVKMPFEIVVQLINDINKQLQEQNNKPTSK